MNQQDYIHIYQQDLRKVIKEIEEYSNEEDIWLVEPFIKNSAGHLAQHLIGNLKTFVAAPLGGFSYTRDRAAEFNERRFSYAELLKELYVLVEEIGASISRIEDLNAPYSEEIKVVHKGQTVSFMLCYLLAHLSYHTGQINYHRRLIGNRATPIQK